ncbi:MAG: hypothetical protein CL927_01195 [Deltaproteobacteria bacterium]|nr:hypothetical protein [Deltaproteobacteria bacterium]HCH63283.1 hypothetical protein [Deltaproteobacteria bacterium]
MPKPPPDQQIADLFERIDRLTAELVVMEQDLEMRLAAVLPSTPRDAVFDALSLLDGAEEGGPNPEVSVSPEQRQYEAAAQVHGPDIADAKAEARYGGQIVIRQHAAAEKLVIGGRWKAALSVLQTAAKNALKVKNRKPWVEARRAYWDAVTAATAITVAHPEGGETWGARIGEALDTAKQQAAAEHYGSAATSLHAAHHLTMAAHADASVCEAREAANNARTANLESMRELLATGGPPSVSTLATLRERATAEIHSLSEAAAAAGDDPDAPGREPIANTALCEALFQKHDWFALKDLFHSQENPSVEGISEVTKDIMWDLWRYRKKYIDDAFDTLRSKYPNLIAKASGSVNLESDIDVTFASPGGAADVTAAKEFNATVFEQFGKPPGRTFDVNIYPRDYRAIQESFNPDFNLTPIEDHDLAQPTGPLLNLSRIDQDVATLLKQRRFLDETSYVQLERALLSTIQDDAVREQTERRFEEANAVYLITVREKVAAILSQDGVEDAIDESENASLAELLRRYQALDSGDVRAAQTLLPFLLTELEDALPALVMKVTDEAYLDRMATLRDKQAEAAELEHPSADLEVLYRKQVQEEPPPAPALVRWREEQLNRLKAQAKRQTFENIIFANEAYMSEGAIEHIVAGGQAKKANPQRAQQIIAGLTPSTLLQSCNEQLADFFKDMKAYETKLTRFDGNDDGHRRETGEAFVHASKYLVRLLDSAQLLSEKSAAAGTTLEFELLRRVQLRDAELTTPRRLHDAVKTLLYQLRGSDRIPQSVKGELGVAEVERIFGVSTVPAFRTLLQDFAVELNAQIRSSATFQAEQAATSTARSAYFGVPLPHGRLAELLGDVQRTLRGLDTEHTIEALITQLVPYGAGQSNEAEEVAHQQEVARALAALEKLPVLR